MRKTHKQSTKGVRLFCGTLVTVFDYSSCKHVTSTTQECSHITVQIEDIIDNSKDITQEKINRIALETMGKIDTKATNLEKAIVNGQMKTKRIDKQTMPCRRCELSGLDGICYQKMMILEPPSILVLHIDRRENINGKFTKSNHIVTYPERLNVEPFCSILLKETEADQEVSYNLFGVVSHSGSLNSGHYVAYIKTVQNTANDWYKQMQNHWTFDAQESYEDKVERKLEELKQIQKSVHVISTENRNSDKRYTYSFSTPEMEIRDEIKWYCIDDNKVECCKTKEAINNKNAYLLMYAKQRPEFS
ncbi:ubiquitin carboxyl-terminal hydrolase 16/45-like isoform X1 [Mytilus trossulus]|uniref:ubiquitin carboxyl-terminal hydrolase 16/45-like isoform X1 n=1 Tax=Mytilus trossulus TaxID=6551 RepID=UPI0030066156